MKRDDVFAILSENKNELMQRGVKHIAIFGSVARGDSDEFSDVDVLVVFDRPVGIFEFVRLKLLLEEWIGCPVDLVTPDALHPALRDRILKEAVYVG